MRFLQACCFILLTACSARIYFERQIVEAEDRFKEHIGLMIYDPSTRRTLIDHNSAKYFTPASNTKTFTFYTCLQLLGDSVPGLKYKIIGDSLIFKGTGDPSLLYANVGAPRRVVDFLRSSDRTLYFSIDNFRADRFGPGWAWDDYPYYYSVERSSLPVYGNLASIRQLPDWTITPTAFQFIRGDSALTTSISRDEGVNRFVLHPGVRTTSTLWQLPFHCDAQTVSEILSAETGKPVTWTRSAVPPPVTVLYSMPADSLYREMMQSSDNFIAEQLLLMCADAVSDTLNPEIAIRYSLKNFLGDLPDQPVWVDGSGLSRYNLFTPRSIVRLWEKLLTQVPRDRLFRILPAGGRSGTLRNYFSADSPYIFGKTGSLSNNLALSGYLITRKGKLLIFSFMNSNFVDSQPEIRHMMEKILAGVRERY